MKWKDAPLARELAKDVAAATVAVLEEMAQKQDVAKAIKSERVQRAINYLNGVKQARETAAREAKLNGLAAKVDGIASFVEAEQAKKTARPTRIQRILSTICSQNRSSAERAAEKREYWAAKARKTDDPYAVFNSMFTR